MTGIAIAIAMIAFLLATVAMLAYVIYYYVLRGALARTTSDPAKVLFKKQREWNSSANCDYDEDILGDALDNACYSHDYFVVFEVHGRQQEFPVSEQIYADLCEGDTGLLIHKGNLFRQFVKSVDIPASTGRAQIRKV